MKNTTSFEHFEALDIRVGRIIKKVEDAQTRRPAYRMTIDFGDEVREKISCGAYTNYPKQLLLGKSVIGVVNFEPKKMGPEVSEVLILGVPNERGETVYLAPESDVALGVAVF